MHWNDGSGAVSCAWQAGTWHSSGCHLPSASRVGRFGQGGAAPRADGSTGITLDASGVTLLTLSILLTTRVLPCHANLYTDTASKTSRTNEASELIPAKIVSIYMVNVGS